LWHCHSADVPSQYLASLNAAVQVRVEVTFGDPGYLFTSKMLVQSALTLLQEREQIAATVSAAGGVCTVGALFRNSSLIDRLGKAGVQFAVTKQ
jgi:hypothetical protein